MVKPSDTPLTILLILARVVPHIMRACFVSFFGLIQTWLSSMEASTLSTRLRVDWRSLPFTDSSVPARSTVTPLGTTPGYVPTRAIAVLLRRLGRGLRCQHWQRGPPRRTSRRAGSTEWRYPNHSTPSADRRSCCTRGGPASRHAKSRGSPAHLRDTSVRSSVRQCPASNQPGYSHGYSPRASALRGHWSAGARPERSPHSCVPSGRCGCASAYPQGDRS